MPNNDIVSELDPKQRYIDMMRGPGEVAIDIKDSTVDSINEHTNGGADKVADIVEDGANWFSEKWAGIKEAFGGVNYDEEAQEAYGNRAEIISQFAQEYRAKELTPETMRNMEYLKDSGALDASGDDNTSARISGSFLEMVKEDPGYYGLQQTGMETYDNGAQDIPVYESVKL